MQKSVFVLGADDPEMRRMESWLEELNYEFIYGEHQGERCSPRTAYIADNDLLSYRGHEIIFVECSVTGTQPFKVIDHHRPGDYGYDMGYERYFEASSLGQLLRFLGKMPKSEDYLYAAMDHCFQFALAGLCQGVEASEVLELSNKEIMCGSDICATSLEEITEYYRDAFDLASTIILNGQVVYKLGKHFYTQYDPGLLIMRTVISQRGGAVLYDCINYRSKRRSLRLFGVLKPETVDYFISDWGPGQNLKEIFGVPKRGYAGGYLP